MKKIVGTINILLFSFSVHAFNTLQQASYYAHLHPEYPSIKNPHSLKPDYSPLYTSTSLTIFPHILESIMGSSQSSWTPEVFKTILHKVVKEREKQGNFGNFIFVNTPAQGTQFIVLGPLLGDFHSLVRDLKQLERMGFIDNNLKLIKPHTYLVFNGNVINGSPYVLETLTLVLFLMHKNPHAVIYIKGHYEADNYWHNTLLKDQLKLQAHYLSNEAIPLARLVSRFFNILPLGIYLNSTNPQEGLLRISYFSLDENYFSDASCTQSIVQQHSTMDICKLKPASQKNNVPISAIVKSENRLISYKQNPGLALLEPEQGATAWSVFSSPNPIYRKYFSFVYDAFAVITIGSSLAETSITLYHQDVRDLLGFNKVMAYNILTGQTLLYPISDQPPFTSLFTKRELRPSKKKVAPLLTVQNIIRFGSTLDLSRSNQIIDKALRAGLSALVNRVNQRGGINGKLMRVTILDDFYTPSISRANIESFIKSGIRFILIPEGTAPLLASLDLIKAKEIFVLFPSSGGLELRQPDLTTLVNFRQSYAMEAKALVLYMLKNQSSRKFAFFYEDSSFGQNPLGGARQVLKKEGIKEWIEAPYLANTVQVEPAVEAIKKGNPDTIAFFSDTSPTQELIRQLGSEFLAGKKLLAISTLGVRSFKDFIKSSGLLIFFSQVVPDPQQSTLKIVKEYRTEIAKLGFEPDTYSLEGYIDAALTAHYFKRMRKPFTFEALSKLIENTKNYPYKGLMLNFNPKTRELSNSLWIEQPDGKWVEQKRDAIEKELASPTLRK